MTLADSATQTFLSTKEVVVLATLQPDGSPLAMPMWFLHDPTAITMISVDGLQKVAKDAFPTASVYGKSGDPSLRLITCGGPFDQATGHYTDNIIVYAHLVGS